MATGQRNLGMTYLEGQATWWTRVPILISFLRGALYTSVYVSFTSPGTEFRFRADRSPVHGQMPHAETADYPRKPAGCRRSKNGSFHVTLKRFLDKDSPGLHPRSKKRSPIWLRRLRNDIELQSLLGEMQDEVKS